MVGVGRMAWPDSLEIWSRCTATHCRRRSGNRARAQAVADAADAADQLAHDFGPLRIAEIEIVGERQRLRADRGEIAPGFRHRLLAALERIGLAIARRHIGGQRQRLGAVVDAHHGGVAARPLHGVAEDDVIVLLPDPALGAKIRRADQFFQRVGVSASAAWTEAASITGSSRLAANGRS